MPLVWQEHPGTHEEAVFLAAFVDNSTAAGESEAVRIPRQGKTRQVIKNQRSYTTRRRSRDIAPRIFLKPVTAKHHFSVSQFPMAYRRHRAFYVVKSELEYTAMTIELKPEHPRLIDRVI